MDGSTAEFTPKERARIRAATTWVEGSRPILNPAVVAIKNWKAWLFALIALAILRSPEIAVILDMIMERTGR